MALPQKHNVALDLALSDRTKRAFALSAAAQTVSVEHTTEEILTRAEDFVAWLDTEPTDDTGEG